MPEPTGYHDRRASDEVLARRELLVERILAELARAGLPAYRYPADMAWPAGVEVCNDPMREDMGGGIFLRWTASPELKRAVLGLPDGDLDDDAVYEALKSRPSADHPVVRHHAAVVKIMQTAIIGILCSAGLRAYDPEDEDAPTLVRVDVP
ncbi:hypothetical protein [Kutzneria chonburiensis]|uniref:Uncharacterized protein n=1 Tax=Kutzneria chonburiensis TaxID=1483604 RepID=A0ABV6MUE0_9PSEU|nr:hypothetical protein [Kutzneria chonburiensis]